MSQPILTCAHRLAHEERIGIYRVASRHVFDSEIQIIDLSRMRLNAIDPRLRLSEFDRLADSSALMIINIDFPLGMAAYQVLAEISHNIATILGVYIMGKAATLNGRIGDVMLPSVVFDEHSQNTYLFHNCVSAETVSDNLVYGNVLDNQKRLPCWVRSCKTAITCLCFTTKGTRHGNGSRTVSEAVFTK